MKATWESVCPDCHDDILIGDEIQAVVCQPSASGARLYNGVWQHWVHVNCDDSERLTAALRGANDGSVCADCWQVRSAAGTCACA